MSNTYNKCVHAHLRQSPADKLRVEFCQKPRHILKCLRLALLQTITEITSGWAQLELFDMTIHVARQFDDLTVTCCSTELLIFTKNLHIAIEYDPMSNCCMISSTQSTLFPLHFIPTTLTSVYRTSENVRLVWSTSETFTVDTQYLSSQQLYHYFIHTSLHSPSNHTTYINVTVTYIRPKRLEFKHRFNVFVGKLSKSRRKITTQRIAQSW